MCPEQAFVLISTELGKLWHVAQEARKIEGVKIARTVAGVYDVVVYVETDSLEIVIEQIHSIKGILKIRILIALEDRYV
jgi:hypothetical protein